jgi:integrative and conjugative element protein (TIGR02256 family)
VRCYITTQAVEKIAHEMDKFPKAETGGHLLGYKDQSGYVITHATGPGKGAVHRYAYFEMGNMQDEVDQIWRDMFGAVTIIGYWHRHFEAVPRPSQLDTDSHTGAKYPLMLIVGTQQSKVWDREMKEVELFSWISSQQEITS